MSVIREAQQGRRRQRRSDRQRRKRGIRKLIIGLLLVTGLMGIIYLTMGGDAGREIANPEIARIAGLKTPRWVEKKILPEGSNSRRGDLLEACNGVVIHYVGNPGTTAEQNWRYYKNPDTQVNSHFLIGLEGEVIQCLPLEEKSSATSERNRDTISIEVCHPDETGRFTKASYDSLVRLTAWLLDACALQGEEVLLRHYDATGKECPLYYVRHEEAWLMLKADVAVARQNP